MRKVDKSGSRDCIGRFLHVKIRFNVREPLMRGTFVTFPDEGKLWVDFKYEALPKYCLICGMLGHAMRVCKEIQEEGRLEDGRSREMEEGYAFKGLDADTDLRGNPLGSGGRGKTSGSSTGGRKNQSVIRMPEAKNTMEVEGRVAPQRPPEWEVIHNLGATGRKAEVNAQPKLMMKKLIPIFLRVNRIGPRTKMARKAQSLQKGFVNNGRKTRLQDWPEKLLSMQD